MGKVKVSDMIGSNTKVDSKGAVTGSINFLSASNDVPKEGHWFPTEISKKYYGQTLHAGGQVVGDDFVAGSDFTPSEVDPYLNVRVESCTDGNKISVYDTKEKTELFTVDFNKATLEPPIGESAVIVPDTTKSFGRYGNASDFYGEKPTISWSGVNGKVRGTFKWFAGTAEKLTEAGNYYPLVLNDFFNKKSVTVNDKTAKDFEWIVNVTEKKKITVEYEGKTVAVLDLSSATFNDASSASVQMDEESLSFDEDSIY